jgi:hypothetical protein
VFFRNFAMADEQAPRAPRNRREMDSSWTPNREFELQEEDSSFNRRGFYSLFVCFQASATASKASAAMPTQQHATLKIRSR